MSVVDLKSISGITSITTPASDNKLTLHTNNTTERLRITSAGKVGINTTSPARIIHAWEPSSNNLLFLESGNTNCDVIQADTGGSTRLRSTQGAFYLYTNGDANSSSAANSDLAFRIDADKDVHVYDDLFIPDKIIHEGDTDTAIRFPGADQIQLDTGGTNYLKLHRYASVNFVEVGASASISLANNGANARAILIGDANHTSTGRILMQAGAGSQGHGGAVTLYSHANSTNAGGVYIGKSLNSSGSIIFGNGGTSPNSEYLRIASDGKIGMGGATNPEELLDLGNALQVNLKIGGRGYLGQGYSTAATILGHSVKAKTTGTVSGGMEVTETNSGGGAPAAIRMQSGTFEFHTAASGTSGATFDSERLRIDSSGNICGASGIINLKNPSGSGDVFVNMLGTSGDARLDLESTGNGNYSGIDFVRERASGTGVVGGAIFMKSDTSNNQAHLYIQAQSASAQSPVTSALAASNGVRLLLEGGSGKFGISSGDTERFLITATGGCHIGLPATTNAWDTHAISLATNSATFACPATVAIFGGTGFGTANMAGGGIRFVGYYDANNFTTFGHIAGVKENTTSGNYSGALTFHTRVNGALGAERLRITSGGTLQVGAAVHNSGDIDASNTKLTIKQTANHMEDGIYIERSGERKGYYIRVNPSGGVGDALSITTNNNGSKNDAMYIDRDCNINLGVSSQTDSKSLYVGGKTSYAVFRTHNNRGMEWNYNAIRSPQNHSSGISGWVFLGHDYGANPYPVRTFKIAAPESGVQGTRVYQVWHDGDANYDYGGLWEIRINQWTSSARFESVAIRCVNGKRDDLCVRAYNDSNGIMIRSGTIWGNMYIRLAGYDDGQGYRGSSYCAVANNGALAIYNAQGTDSGTVPTGGSPVDVFPFDGNGGSHTGGRDIENSNWFAG